MFLVGLSVILALIFGAATMAMGADGKPFLLGKKNVASAVSKLVKSGVGPALSLTVDSGPPMAVNSSTKVTNLNADKVDGLEGASFIQGGGRASQGKVAIPAGSSATILQTSDPAVNVLYTCPSNPMSQSRRLDIVEGETESLNALIDAKSINGVVYAKLGPNDSHSTGLTLATGSADHVTLQVQGTNVATIEVFTVPRPGGPVSAGDFHTQAQAFETR